MRTFRKQLTAEVMAHTGVTLCRSEDEERVEQHCRETAEKLDYDFWAWSGATGLRCHTDPSKTPTGKEAAFSRELSFFLGMLLNWTRGAAVVVAHDIVSTINHKERGGPDTARMLRTIVQLQRALNEENIDDEDRHRRIQAAIQQGQEDLEALSRAHQASDDKAVSQAAQQLSSNAAALAAQYEIPTEQRIVQVVLCDSEEMPRPCGADAIDMELPTHEERTEIVEQFIESREALCGDSEAVVSAAAGLTEFQLRKVLLLSFVTTDELDPVQIAEYKKRALQAHGITYVDPDPRGFDAIGGMEPLKRWLRARAVTYDRERAQQYGIEPAKGLVIAGPPGVGKSSAFKAIPTEWSKILGSCTAVSLDIGATRSRWQGESEERLRRALAVIDALSPAGGAPCVVLIDEADRGLAGSTNSGDLDGGVAGRVFQTLLTWMQERSGDFSEAGNSFLYMTTNHVESLPPELTRAGRVDGLFWASFPTEKERNAIIDIYRQQYNKAADVDVETLVRGSVDRTGAELESAFREASIQALVAEQATIGTADVQQALDTLPKVRETYEMTPETHRWKDAAIKANEKTISLGSAETPQVLDLSLARTDKGSGAN